MSVLKSHRGTFRGLFFSCRSFLRFFHSRTPTTYYPVRLSSRPRLWWGIQFRSPDLNEAPHCPSATSRTVLLLLYHIELPGETSHLVVLRSHLRVSSGALLQCLGRSCVDRGVLPVLTSTCLHRTSILPVLKTYLTETSHSPSSFVPLGVPRTELADSPATTASDSTRSVSLLTQPPTSTCKKCQSPGPIHPCLEVTHDLV